MRNIALTTLVAFTFATASFAGSDKASDLITMETMLGHTKEEITASLVNLGFEVRKFEIEDDKMEVYFVGHGKMGEVYVNPETGLPSKIEIE